MVGNRTVTQSSSQIKKLVAKAFELSGEASLQNQDALIDKFCANSRDISTFKSCFPVLVQKILEDYEKSKIPGYVLLECLGPDFEKLNNTRRDKDSEKLASGLTIAQYSSVCAFLRFAVETQLGYPAENLDYVAARALRYVWNIRPNPARSVGKNWYKQMLEYKPVTVKLDPERRKLLTNIKSAFRSVPRPKFHRWSGDPGIDRWAVELKKIDWWKIHPRYLEMNQDIRCCADSKSLPFVIAAFLQSYVLGFCPTVNGVQDLIHRYEPGVLKKNQQSMLMDIDSALSR